MKYLFDLDETLIHSDSLNCDAYNYALAKCGYPRIEDCLRLTRDSLQFIPTTDLKKSLKSNRTTSQNRGCHTGLSSTPPFFKESGDMERKIVICGRAQANKERYLF